MLADTTGYTVDFNIYTGKEGGAELGLTFKVQAAGQEPDSRQADADGRQSGQQLATEEMEQAREQAAGQEPEGRQADADGRQAGHCHPHYQFLPDWDITHSPKHWSNEDTMIQYVKNIIIVPYIKSTHGTFEEDTTVSNLRFLPRQGVAL